MTLTYGGFPLNLPRGDPKLRLWLDRYLPTLDLFPPAPPHRAGSARILRQRFEADKGIGMPTINWPDPPPLKLNTIYWPTGASRFARAVFLADKTTKNAIARRARGDDGNTSTALTLAWGDPALGGVRSTEMYLLPPRPLSNIADRTVAASNTLWLLPLVDVRYWWQFVAIEAPDVDRETTWHELSAALGLDLDLEEIGGDDVDAAYLSPDPVEFNRPYFNAAAMLDALAWSTGQRIVRQLDGTVEALAAPEELDKPAATAVIAGGEHGSPRADLPASLSIAFRKSKWHGQLADAPLHAYEVAAPEEAGAEGFTATILGAALADFSGETSDPDNNTALQALADKIAADFYAWRSIRFSYTLAAAQPWTFTGLEDAAAWEFGAIDDTGQLFAQTRVWSLSPAVMAETHGASDPAAWLIEPRQWGVLQAALSQGGSANVWIVMREAGWEYTDPAITVPAYDFLMNTGESMADNTKVRIEWDGVVWSIVNGMCVASDTLPTEPEE